MDNNVKYYDKQYAVEINYRYKTNTRYQRFLLKKLYKYISKGEIRSLCDVGCGQGLNTAFFAEDFPKAKITGVDLSRRGINYAKEKYKKNKQLEFICADIRDFDLGKKSFDIVSAFELLEHIKDWKSVGDAMTKAAKRYIIVSAPIGRMRKYEVQHGHCRNFKKGELEHFFSEHGFVTIKAFYAGFPFWSPITRDLLNIPIFNTRPEQGMSSLGKIISVTLYFLFSRCSMKTKGDQFMGLFEKRR